MTPHCDKNEQTLHSEIKALKELIEVAKTVVSTLDLDTVLQAILTSAMGFAETPAGSVALYDADNKELSLHAHAGLTADFLKKDRWHITNGGLTSEVLENKTVLFIEDTDKTPYFKNPVAIKEGIKSLICVPLSVRDLTVGILYLDDFIPRQFDREKLNLLSVLSSFASMAIYNAKLHNRTKIMAITDSMTSLNNYRQFNRIFPKEMDRARRHKHPLSLIMIDVDDFKKFNDTYGHYNGDKILETLGDLINSTLRQIDYAFRYGGEEFIVLLPETKHEEAILVAERLRELIKNETQKVMDAITGHGVTISIGIVSYPKDGTSREELFKKADDYLYKAKHLGKDAVYYNKESIVP